MTKSNIYSMPASDLKVRSDGVYSRSADGRRRRISNRVLAYATVNDETIEKYHIEFRFTTTDGRSR